MHSSPILPNTSPNSISRRSILLAAPLPLPLLLPNQANSTPAAIPTYQLGSIPISRVVKGCWQLSGGHRGDKNTDRTTGRAALEDLAAYYAAGVTTFDTADIYGPSQSLIGDYIRASNHPPNLRILSKSCWFGASQLKPNVEKNVTSTIQALGQSPDLVQFYWNDYDVGDYKSAALQLADLRAKGLMRELGATNFDTKRLEAMEDAKLVSHQVQYSLLDTRCESVMVDYCRAKKIALLPYGTLAGGFLTDFYLNVPASAVKLDTYSKQKYSSVIAQVGGWDWLQELLRALRVIADRHGSTIAQVAMRWVLERDLVGGILVGARNASHVNDYSDLFTFALTGNDYDLLETVLRKKRVSRGDFYTWERGGVW